MSPKATSLEEQIQFPPGTTDSHFHLLELERHGIDPAFLLERLAAHSFGFGLEIAINEKNFARRLQLAEPYPELYLTAGIHPCSSAATKAELEHALGHVAQQLSHPKVRAVGETGIDLFREYSPLEHQCELFAAQLCLAAERQLPVIIHNRNADKEILSMLQANPPPAGGVMHCYSSGLKFAHSCLELGMYISFAGNLSFKKAQELRDIVPRLPPERILVETDAPYLSPHPFRGKTNHPGRIGMTIAVLAEQLRLSEAETAGLTTRNLHRLLALGDA